MIYYLLLIYYLLFAYICVYLLFLEQSLQCCEGAVCG